MPSSKNWSAKSFSRTTRLVRHGHSSLAVLISIPNESCLCAASSEQNFLLHAPKIMSTNVFRLQKPVSVMGVSVCNFLRRSGRMFHPHLDPVSLHHNLNLTARMCACEIRDGARAWRTISANTCSGSARFRQHAAGTLAGISIFSRPTQENSW